MTDLSDRCRFERFAAAMDAARDAKAPQLMLYDDTPAAASAPAAGRALPARALRRPLVWRLGIGGLGLGAVLLLALLTPPIGAAIDWLTEPRPEPPPDRAAAAAPADLPTPPPEPAAGANDPPPPRALPALADGALQATPQPVAPAPAARVARVTGLDAAARPRAGSLPVPTFKPSPADQ